MTSDPSSDPLPLSPREILSTPHKILPLLVYRRCHLSIYFCSSGSVVLYSSRNPFHDRCCSPRCRACTIGFQFYDWYWTNGITSEPSIETSSISQLLMIYLLVLNIVISYIGLVWWKQRCQVDSHLSKCDVGFTTCSILYVCI